MTAFDEVRRLASEVAIHLASARDEPNADVASGFRETAGDYRAKANHLLAGAPLEVLSRVYGWGLLVGVDPTGLAVFHPDSRDSTVTVPMVYLREPAR